MNERIRELRAQCAEESIDGPGYPYWVDQEKFALLIVKECLGIINKEHDEGIDRHGDYQLALYEAYREILEHFGVEERMNERIINDLAVKSGLAEDMGRGYKFPDNYLDFAELIVRQCGYYADIFEATGCPADMDITETKPSDYIKEKLGVK